MKLPSFVIIGAPKSGTTSLYHYLKQHPDIYLPEKKELHYFSYQYLINNCNGPGDKDVLRNLAATFDEYCDYFKHAGDHKIVGEVSPSYLYYSDTRKAIKSTLQDVSIIVILRNPIQKAYSQYMHLVRENLETLSFASALESEKSRYKAGWSDIWRYAESSLYTQRLQDYIETFGKDRIKIVLYDELQADAASLMRLLYAFIGVDPHVTCNTEVIYNRTGPPKSKYVANVLFKPSFVKDIAKMVLPQRLRMSLKHRITEMNTGAKPPIDKTVYQYLRNYFYRDIADLQDLIHKKLTWLEG